MHTLTTTEQYLQPLEQPSIFHMLPVPLVNVPFHHNTDCITRYFAEHFPLHVAVHEVSPISVPPAEYTQPHLHEDAHEVNMIISGENLLYKIRVGKSTFTVSNNASIWIPAGTIHSANVLQGSGFFITLRLPL